MNSIFPSKDKTRLSPNIMSQNNVSTLHKCFKTVAVEQTKKSIQSRELLTFSLHATINVVSEQEDTIKSQLSKARKLIRL